MPRFGGLRLARGGPGGTRADPGVARARPFWYPRDCEQPMTEPRHDDGMLEPIEPAPTQRGQSLVEPPPPGGHTEIERIPAAGPLPAVPGQPPVTTAV